MLKKAEGAQESDPRGRSDFIAPYKPIAANEANV